ncbi:MAG: ABC transporter ATP-binding protein, partial [Bdellovibrionia bacterium]
MSKKQDLLFDPDELEVRRVQAQSFKRLTLRIVKHRSPLLLGILMVVLVTACLLLEPRVIGYLIDEAILPGRLDVLKKVALVYALLTSVRIGAAVQQGYFFEKLGQKVTFDLRVELFSKLQSLDVPVYQRHSVGRLMTRVTHDIAAMSEMFSSGALSMLSNGLMVLGILTALMVLNLRLGIIGCSVFPLLVMLSAYFSTRLKRAYQESRKHLSVLNAFLAESLSGIRVLQLYTRVRKQLAEFDRLNESYAYAQTGAIRVFALFQPTITVSAGISLALLIYFGGAEALEGRLKVGVLVTYFSLALSLFQPVREIADKWNTFLSGMTSAERIFMILDWESEFTPQETSALRKPVRAVTPLQGHLVFENVWFSYAGQHACTQTGDSSIWALRDFSLEIRPGEKIGVVGHTGAGKSTLISLLLRFYEPTQGRILLDGKDLKTYSKRSLRAAFGIVQQEAFLFSGTFEENMTFWNSMAQPQLSEYFSDLSVDSPFPARIQEGGSNLSMGERQMMAFARALGSDPKVWILDEATSNMDSQSESWVQKAFEKASEDRTALLIAHRLATVKNVDRIVVLHQGKLAEVGTHDQLLRAQGLYAQLDRLQ